MLKIITVKIAAAVYYHRKDRAMILVSNIVVLGQGI